MWRLGFDTIPAYLLVVALATLLVAVLVWQRHRTGKTVVVWLSAAVVGILLGSVGSYAAARLAGYDVVEVPPGAPPGAQVVGTEDEGGEEEEGGPAGMGGMPGMGGGPGMRGGFGGPRPKRDLTTTVRKIALLTGDVGITLAPEQSTKLLEILDGIEEAEAMTDEEAQAKQDEILALLDEDQKAQLGAIGLPRRFGRPGAGGPGGGPGGGPPAPDANPFQQETARQAVEGLRQRFAPGESPAAPES